VGVERGLELARRALDKQKNNKRERRKIKQKEMIKEGAAREGETGIRAHAGARKRAKRRRKKGVSHDATIALDVRLHRRLRRN
jgi:hypothetical protein